MNDLALRVDMLDDYCKNGGTVLDWCGLHGVKLSELQASMSKDKWAEIVTRVDGWTIHRVYQEVKRLATSDLRDAYADDGTLLDPKDWPPELAACIAGVESVEQFDKEGVLTGYVKKIKLWDKLGALKLIGGQLSMFESKVPTAEEIVGFAEKLAKAVERARRPLASEPTVPTVIEITGEEGRDEATKSSV